MTAPTLRPYQTDAVRQVAEAFAARVRSTLLVMPTGAGKTVVFSAVADAMPGRVAVVAHRRELIRQARDKLTQAGVASGLYPSADPQRVTVGSIQTLARRLGDLPRFDTLILDECHHAVSGQFSALIASQPQARVFGVTATPERMDGRGLGEVFERLILGPSIPDMIRDGYLCPVRVFAPPGGPDLTGVRVTAGDYNAADLAAVMDKPALTGDLAEHYERITPGRPALVLCCSVAHAEHSAAAFRAEGWRFRCVHGGMRDDARDAAFADFAAGRLDGLTSCDLISEGVDIPRIGVVILARPTRSLGLYMQAVGRGFRPYAGKADLIVLDHAGCALRLGLPDAPREWSLAGRPKRAAVPSAAQCPSCFVIHTPAPTCPECGHDYSAARVAAERREIERIAGELAELTPEDRRLRHLRTTPLRDLTRGASFDELVEIGVARGYADTWPDTMARIRSEYR